MLPKTLKILANGETGTGKTYLALTFPKVFYIGTEPNGLDTARANEKLQANLAYTTELVPSPVFEIKEVFRKLDEEVKKAHEMAKKGEVSTLVLDNITFLAQNRWVYINEYEKLYSKAGVLDIRAMYGNLGLWLYRFTLYGLCSFNGNVVVTSHEQREDDEALERVVDKTVPITPNILGSFRNKIGGMFSASLYLGVKKEETRFTYFARCLKGDQRNAKNRYGLPEIVQDVSYDRILQELNGKTAV
jgi:hypothetical protein